MSPKQIGRPMKYRDLLLALETHELYTPAKVADFAVERGFIPEDFVARQRVRIAMGRYTNNHRFPDEGDGLVSSPGQAPTPGWFGWRYRQTAMASEETHD